MNKKHFLIVSKFLKFKKRFNIIAFVSDSWLCTRLKKIPVTRSANCASTSLVARKFPRLSSPHLRLTLALACKVRHGRCRACTSRVCVPSPARVTSSHRAPHRRTPHSRHSPCRRAALTKSKRVSRRAERSSDQRAWRYGQRRRWQRQHMDSRYHSVCAW